MVQPGIPPAFERNERKESEAWEGYDQANYDIERALAFAMDIHQLFHLEVGNVSNSQWSLSYFIHVMVMQLSKYTLHNLVIPWENINKDTLNTSG